MDSLSRKARRGSPEGPIPRLWLVLLLGAAACGELSLSPVDQVVIRTGVLRSEAGEPVPFEILNRTSRTIQFFHCDFEPGIFVDRKTGDVWLVEFTRLACPGNLPSGTVTLDPGSSMESSFTPGRSGTFRVRLPFGLEGRGTDEHVSVSEPVIVDQEGP